MFGLLINVMHTVMYSSKLNKIIFLPLLVLWLSACTDSGPYIFKADEFDRTSPNFAKELKDRSGVEICYNKWSTTPKIVTQMAQDECSRFGKEAHFVLNRKLVCSIGTPAQAVYWCLCPGETSRDRSKNNMQLVTGEKKYTCSKP